MAIIDTSYLASNVSEIETQRTKIMEQLAAGYKINSAADNAAVLAISSQMTKEINSSTVSIRNSNDGISITETGSAALDSITENLQRIREISLAADSGVYSSEDISNMQVEVDTLVSEISRVAEQTRFNGQQLFSGDFSVNIQTGSNAGDSGITINIGNLNIDSLGTDSTNNVASIQGGGANSLSSGNIANTIDIIDNALNQVSSEKANLGSISNRFSSAINSIENNLLSSKETQSRLIDTDYASATAQLTKNLLLENVNISVMAQANSQASNILGLFTL
ncbi:MAG: hypothetical protein L3V56_03800 [Candidatus Magnetoovum sp. WYHC-5]|nr:hypothetical protein [Candidatus Magnetoovum sp. WYHC-5]